MFTNFRRYLQEKAAFSETDLTAVEAVCIYRHLKAGEKLLAEGQTWQHNAFVYQGLTRGYRANIYGEEQTINFSPEDYWTGDREALLTGKPTTVNIEALVDTDLLLIEKADFDRLCIEVAPFSEFMTNLIQRNLLAYQKRLEETRAHTDDEKVLAFKKKFPTVTARAPLYTIATYLDIEEYKLKFILSTLS
jgi:CRP-like cAMP-binding protein